MLIIDGSHGEGGGQVLRSALALSLVTGEPFRIEKIRGGRKKPGLLRQHLTAVEAAAQICSGEVAGGALHSTELTFRPGAVRSGRYRFSIGTAGSCTLVLQTVLLPLLTLGEPSELIVEGGTHNPSAPPFDFLDRTYLPLLRRMGAQVVAALERPGFYPAGGGRIRVEIAPARRLSGLELCRRGPLRGRRARAVLARLPRHIGERELQTLRDRLGWGDDSLQVEQIDAGRGPGNVLVVEIESEALTEVFTGFGERGVAAEKVALQVSREVREYLDAGVPVGRHLADQLLLPLALAGGGAFRTLPPTTHTLTNLEVIRRFLPVAIAAEEISERCWEFRIGG